MNTYQIGDITKIKLVIWDLDETFWSGTLDDGDNIIVPDAHIELLKRLTDIGIVNSICSKNERDKAEKKLMELGLMDYFVFTSIDWSSKGARIKDMIQNMGLRSVNVLFIDDNHLNLEEVKYHSPGINTAFPNLIFDLLEAAKNCDKNDFSHKRLKQYKVLEQKQTEKASYDSDASFLRTSNIRVSIHNDCAEELERIYELVQRSNQLNYTKKRSSIEELKSLLEDPEVTCGTIWVTDRFGDYGMVGFYAVKEQELIHFLFSCRTIGMGIEQYVYNMLGHPHLVVVGDVITMLDDEMIPDWINLNDNNVSDIACEQSTSDLNQGTKHSVLFKGPCDLLRVFNFIDQQDVIDAELTFVNPETGVEIESTNHTCHIAQAFSLSEVEKKRVSKELPFSAEDFFDTKLTSQTYQTVFISTLHDAHLGVYQRKDTKTKIAFGEAKHPMTDPTNYDKYVNNEVYTANCQFTYEFLKWFSENYEFCGRIQAEELCTNIVNIVSHLSPSTHVVLILGVEHAYSSNTNAAYDGLEKVYIENNNAIRKLVTRYNNVSYLAFEDYVIGQKGFYNNINHFVMSVYYEMAQDVIKIINEKNDKTDTEIASKYKLVLWQLIMYVKKIPVLGKLLSAIRRR